MTAICIATNNSNPIGDLSQDQIQAIFSGRVRSWSQVPGATATGPIDLIVRSPASGTQDAFQNIFMGQSLRIAPSASQKASNGLVQQSIRSNKNAIGYVDFNFTAGRQHRRLQGRRPARCATPSPASTAARVTSGS